MPSRLWMPLTGILTLSLLGLPTAVAADTDAGAVVDAHHNLRAAPDRATARPLTPRERAEVALSRAEALRDGHREGHRDGDGGTDATMALTRVLRTRTDLSTEDQARAKRLLARPTAPGGDGLAEYTDAEAIPVCGPIVCVHYVGSTADAPPLDSTDGDAVPDAVQAALATAEAVHQTYTGAGYRGPDPDGTRGSNGDPVQDDKVDVYLADLGDQGLYGYCTSDQPTRTDGGRNYWAYCVIDNDFSPDQYPTHTPAENQQVTLAHEYFHAVQYAYDAGEDPWFMEATATWAEDELYDQVDDNRQYLPAGQLGTPDAPLDYWEDGGSYQYGNWIFFRYLTERWSAGSGGLPTLVRQLLERTSARAGARDDYSTQALQWALARRNTTFTKVYSQFATANRTPARSYSEGSAYRAAAPARTWRLSRSHRSTGGFRAKLWHLSSFPLRYRPGPGTRARSWRIRLRVDMPARRTAPVARVLVVKKRGGVSTSTIRLDRKGRGAAVVPFSSRTVRYVELVLVNASRRTSCWTDINDVYAFACLGTPKDSLLPSDFAANIFRR